MSNKCSPFVFIQFELVKVHGLYLMHQRDINEVGEMQVSRFFQKHPHMCRGLVGVVLQTPTVRLPHVWWRFSVRLQLNRPASRIPQVSWPPCKRREAIPWFIVFYLIDKLPTSPFVLQACHHFRFSVFDKNQRPPFFKSCLGEDGVCFVVSDHVHYASWAPS